MGYELILRAGKLARHAVGVLLLCWRRMLEAMFFGGAIATIVGLLVATFESRHGLPGWPGVIAAAFFGVAVAYAAAATVLIDELLRGMFDIVKVIEGDAEAGARSLVAGAEHERSALLRLFEGSRREEQVTASSSPPSRATGGVASWPTPRDPDRETRQDIADTDDFSNTAPRPRVNARPVRADQLPRIEWQYDASATQGATQAAAPRDVTWDMPTIPTKQPEPVPAQSADPTQNTPGPSLPA